MRETIVCSAWMIDAETTMGSRVKCGDAACPPLPLTTTIKLSTEAMIAPAPMAICPNFKVGVG
ncbi:hypothetical protein D3C77_775620 [compost metagenome]